ncbi:hypothetical protein SAMN06297229_0565 [Pseudidiomarina planktonica]|uniref:Uncharacterized protein n=1 Tax=Pseudidiomarina planktonica TaxID=1323738 RepID=A0A1Y6EMR3_9GAMM|nr:hypothetical protein [Pseudidiomarina planktonica]RUO65965.1 hypothetical protein CWI77_05935 [Pseudidiomarina planktonica]SMQ61453.1 hypothetical protein SAMN06297229_0565 [Pseudidiomarina planktonica]
MTSKIDVIVSSDLDYENLIAEVAIDDIFVGLVTNEPSKGVCFEAPAGQVLGEPIAFDIYIKALIKAKNELLQLK